MAGSSGSRPGAATVAFGGWLVVAGVVLLSDGRSGGNLGGSAAQSVILMLIVIALTVVQFRFVEKKVQY